MPRSEDPVSTWARSPPRRIPRPSLVEPMPSAGERTCRRPGPFERPSLTPGGISSSATFHQLDDFAGNLPLLVRGDDPDRDLGVIGADRTRRGGVGGSVARRVEPDP